VSTAPKTKFFMGIMGNFSQKYGKNMGDLILFLYLWQGLRAITALSYGTKIFAGVQLFLKYLCMLTIMCPKMQA
jgi:hypothetical protein